MVGELNELFAQLADHVDFLTVYIAEAHATDEWPIGSRFKYTQPRTVAARIAIAKEFMAREHYNLPTVVDPCYPADPTVPPPFNLLPYITTPSTSSTTSEGKGETPTPTSTRVPTPAVVTTKGITGVPLPRSNPFEVVYAPWPIRFYLLANGILEHIAAPDQCSYDWFDIKQRLISLIPPTNGSNGNGTRAAAAANK